MGGADSSGRDETILVVDDAEPIRKMVCAMLLNDGYQCLEACDGTEALGIIERAPEIHLVLTDVIMPQMGGAELARHLSILRPEMRIIFMSGYTEDAVIRRVEKVPAVFLPKPFTAAALTCKVRNVLATPWNGVPE